MGSSRKRPFSTFATIVPVTPIARPRIGFGSVLCARISRYDSGATVYVLHCVELSIPHDILSKALDDTARYPGDLRRLLVEQPPDQTRDARDLLFDERNLARHRAHPVVMLDIPLQLGPLALEDVGHGKCERTKDETAIHRISPIWRCIGRRRGGH